MAGFQQYLEHAMRHAEYERLPSGEWYAHIPGFPGLWATGPNVESARADLLGALDEWLLVSAAVSGQPLPEIEGLVLRARRIAE